MDISTVPRVDAIVLTGLDYSMKPDRVRYEVDKGFITPFPEVKVMHQIKSLAVMVYNQEKLTSLYHGNICDARNALAYFICAVHRQQAPQPQTHTRQGSTSSVESNSSKISCKSTGHKKNCELPKLVTTSMLPLGYWDGLYYALVAEIRSLHQDLQQRFGFGCETGTAPLHYRGPDGTTNQPINAIELASMLETAWYALMDNRLVATLDDAVRMRKMRENAAQQLSNPAATKEDWMPDRPPIVYGLMDVNDLTPEIINSILWDKHKTEVDRACTENFEDESMMTAHRAELHRKQMEDTNAAAFSSSLKSATPCTCHSACVCKMKCDETAEGCTCQNQVHVYHVLHEEGSDSTGKADKFVKQDDGKQNPFIGTASSSLAQMQISSLRYPDVKSLTTRHGSNQPPNNATERRPNLGKARSNTANSDLAYVPTTGASFRGPKDTMPLGFYGRDSGQRYPNPRPQTPYTFPDEASLFNQVPSAPSAAVPRKPVPLPIFPTTPAHAASHQRPLTPPTSSPTASTSAYTWRKNQQPPYGAQDYIGILPDHPFESDDDNELTPVLTRPTTKSSSGKAKRTSPISTRFPGFKPFRSDSNAAISENPFQSQPMPDFIAPKVATKQRYFHAGGNAKLADREEIKGPAFRHTPIPEYSGHGMAAEAANAAMKDPEWVKKHFGEAAMGVAASRAPVRGSEDSFAGVIRNSGVEDAAAAEAVDKRDRTSSGASKRSKFMRVFSRKNSGARGDEE